RVSALASLAELTEPERLRLAQALVTRAQPDWLTRLLMEKKFKLHVYHCSSRAHRLADVTGPEEIRPALAAIHELPAVPNNGSSQLGTAVEQVLRDFRGTDLAAIIMLTDGIPTTGKSLAKVAGPAKDRDVPLFFVGLGDAQPVRDLELHDLKAADAVYI